MAAGQMPAPHRRGKNNKGSDSKTLKANYRGLADMSPAEVEQLPDDGTWKPSEKARNFVKHWASGESIRNAAYKAGYGLDAAYAYKLVRHPTVLRMYNEEKVKYEQAAQMTRKKVMDGLLEAVEMAKLMAEPASMIAGWREIGKMCGYYEPVKKTIDVNVTGNVVMERLNRLSDAELLKLITQEVSSVVEQELLTDESGDEDA
jgi:phage terminase small subunit